MLDLTVLELVDKLDLLSVQVVIAVARSRWLFGANFVGDFLLNFGYSSSNFCFYLEPDLQLYNLL